MTVSESPVHKSPGPTIPGLAEAAVGPSRNRPILLVARNSGEGGKKAREQVADEAWLCAEDLLSETGIDVKPLMPSKAEIVRKLKEEPDDRIESTEWDGDEKSFTNEYVLFKLSPEVYLLVSTGSGSKIDSNLDQPWLDYLNERVLKKLTPWLMIAHRLDRIFRTFLLAANTLHYCEMLDIRLYNGSKGLLTGDMASLMALFSAKESAEEARRIPVKTREGQTLATGTDMSDGSVPYGIARVAPPGTVAVRMKAANGMPGKAHLFFDSPETLPRVSEVAYGLPEVYTEVVDVRNAELHEFDADILEAVEVTVEKMLKAKADLDEDEIRRLLEAEFRVELRAAFEADLWADIAEGTVQPTRVDQVANVRLGFSLVGLPGWSINATGRELIKRGFSTARLRMDNTPGTTFSPDHVGTEAERVMRPLIALRKFYETGKLPVKLGVKGIKDFTIENCFPPDGLPWATTEDFRRLDELLANTTGGGPATQGLSGVIFRSPNGDIPLRTAPKDRRRLGPSYVLRAAEAGVRGCISLPPLPHHVLAESIVEALIQHASQLLTPLLYVERPETELLRQKLHDAEKAAAAIRSSCAALLDSLGMVDENGAPIATPEMFKAISERHATRVREEQGPADKAVEKAKTALDEALRIDAESDPALHSKLLLKLVASLRDPYDTSYNDLWKGAIRIETITRTPIKVHDTAGTITRWTGTIRVAGAGEEFIAPFHGEFTDGAILELPAKVDFALTQLQNGVPFDSIDQTNPRGVRLALAERLGFDSRYFGLPTCNNPQLVRIGAHLAIDPERDTIRTADALGEDVALVAEVLRHLTSGRPTWDTIVIPQRSDAA